VDLTGLTGIIYGLLPGLLDKILNCQWFRKKARECLPDISTPPSLPCKPAIKGDLVCCSGNGRATNRSVCAQINEISIELERIKERLDRCCGEGGGDLVRWVCQPDGKCELRVVANENQGYPTEQECQIACVAPPRGGPGTELKKLLAAMGYVATENCPCNARAREMDEKGVQWVRDNTETVIGWLEEQAKERSSWLFTRAGAAALIETACLLAGGDDQSAAGGP